MTVYGNTCKNPSGGIMLQSDLEEALTGEPRCKITDKTFKNELVHLDFTHYERCTFEKCKLHLKYGNYKLIDCNIVECEILLEMPALGVAVLLAGYYGDKPIEFQDASKVMQKIKRVP